MRKMSKLRSLAMIMIPLVLCVSLLIGYTQAWFTVEVENSENNIEAGTMEISVLKYNEAKSAYQDIGNQKLFDEGYWEPGTTKIAYLAVKNMGSLNLAYSIKLNSEEGAIALSEVMEYAIISPMNKGGKALFDSWSAITSYEGVKTGNLAKGDLDIAKDTALRIGDTKYFMLAVHMKDDASIAYQSGWMELDLEVTAKQIPGESDYFGSNYDAGAGYINGATVSALWENLIKGGTYDFENGLDKRMTALKGTMDVVDDFTRAESTKILKVGADSRVQFNQKSSIAELTVGYYKLTGYVKLGDVDPSKVSFTIWAYKNIIDGSNIVTPVIADSILVDADESGWAYFEMTFDHGEAYSLLQFNITNSDTQNPVYFDDFRYLKYVGTEDIPGYKPEKLESSDPNSPWQPYARLDFEGSQFPMVAADDKHENGDLGTPGHGESAQSLRLEGNEQAKYAKGAILASGWYRVRGYVKLDGAKPENVQVTVWGYTGTKENNAKTLSMADAVIGQEDADGWSYFEILFDHKVNYTLIQFIARNYGATTVYFDDFEYEKYTGSGVPSASTQPPVQPSTGASQKPVITWTVLADLNFENGTLADSHVTPWDGKTNSMSLATTVGHGSSKSLQVDNTARAKFYQAGTALQAGWYRIGGYVKLNGADASKISIQPWVRKADGKTNDATSYALSKYIVGQPDADGWSYFELYIQQLAAQPTFQFVFNNNANSGKTVFFDNVIFEKYNKEGKPPMVPTPEVTPPVIVPPTTEPGAPTETWTNYANLSFETGTLAESYVTAWNDSTSSISLATTEGYNSSKSLQVDNTARAKFYQAGVTLPAGWYRLSGYVKLNGADASKISVTPWVKQADGKTNDITVYNFENIIVGQPDENGWSYFELDVQQLASQPTFQFVFNNNANSGKTVYFDNITYAKYNGEGQPTPTEPPAVEIPLWQDWTVLDFETGTLADSYVTAWNDSTNSISLATTVGYDSSKSLQVDNTARAKFYQAGVTLPAGWYRLSGYVKLNGADAAKVSIQPWVKKADNTNSTTSYNLSGCIIGQADENGWSYFELDIQHQANQPAFQVVFNNNASSGKTVYFDSIKYAGYLGNGQPAPTEPPAEEIPQWEEVANVDFETGTLADNYCNSVQGSGNPGVLAENVGYNSNKSLQVNNGTRPKYYKAGASIPAGWYRISGYVKLNGADAAKVSVQPWIKKADNTNDTTEYTLAGCIIGSADANGWSYFEKIVYQNALQANYQVVFNNNKGSGVAVYFDNFKYEKYLGEGQPMATQPQESWNVLTELDFEGTQFPMVPNSTYALGDFGTPGYGGAQSLRLENNEQAKYTKSATLTVGDYRLSGYVKLGTANPATVSITVWAYQGVGLTNTYTQSMADAVIGQADANGWSYFEINFDIATRYNTIQFIAKNSGAGATVYFDNIQYKQSAAGQTT